VFTFTSLHLSKLASMTLFKMCSTRQEPLKNSTYFFQTFVSISTICLYDVDISLGLYDVSFLSICLYDGTFGVF